MALYFGPDFLLRRHDQHGEASGASRRPKSVCREAPIRTFLARRLFQRAIAIGMKRFAKPWEDTSSKWPSMPWVGKRSTI